MTSHIQHTHRAALARAEWVLRSLLPDELVSATPQGMEVPRAPDASECYLLCEHLGLSIMTTGLALVVESYAPTTITDYQSDTPTQRRAILRIPARARILVSRLAQPEYTRPNTSRPCSFEEQLQLASEVYKGAMMAIIYRDVPDATVITDVHVTRDHAALSPDGEGGFIGVALVEFDITCEALLPAPRRHTQPGRFM